MLCRRNALSKLNHPLALQVGVDQIHRQHPSGVIESVELDAVLMLPRVVTLTAIPFDQVCEINCGLCWHVEGCNRILANVKEHATPLAGAGVETGLEVHTTGDVAGSAASGGCCVSSCSASSIPLDWAAIEVAGVDSLNEKMRAGKHVIASSFVSDGNPCWVLFPKGPDRLAGSQDSGLALGSPYRGSPRDSSPSSASKIQDTPSLGG